MNKQRKEHVIMLNTETSIASQNPCETVIAKINALLQHSSHNLSKVPARVEAIIRGKVSRHKLKFTTEENAGQMRDPIIPTIHRLTDREGHDQDVCAFLFTEMETFASFISFKAMVDIVQLITQLLDQTIASNVSDGSTNGKILVSAVEKQFKFRVKEILRTAMELETHDGFNTELTRKLKSNAALIQLMYTSFQPVLHILISTASQKNLLITKLILCVFGLHFISFGLVE